MMVPIHDLSQVAVVCRIDLNRRSLWHGLAWRWHSKNDTSRNGRGHSQCFDAEHDKSSFFHWKLTRPNHTGRMTGYKAS
jgi:hypothetical protein